MHGGRGQGRKKGGSWRHQELEAQRSWLDRRDRTERPEALESKRARPNSLCGDTLSCRQLISNHVKVDFDRSEAALLGVSCSVGVPVQGMRGPGIRLGTSMHEFCASFKLRRHCDRVEPLDIFARTGKREEDGQVRSGGKG